MGFILLYLDNFDSKFKLRIGLEIVKHTVEDGRVDVSVAGIARRVARRVTNNIITRIAHHLHAANERVEKVK